MYKQFYLMKKEPFDSHPSPELFYKSSPHQKGWDYLVHGLKKNEPILLMAGEYGAGKTLLCLKLVKLLKKNSQLPSVFVPTPTYNFIMVLEKILIELGLPIGRYETDPAEEPRLQQAIYGYFENQTTMKKKFIYVVIDDAQEFDYNFINKLRLFASYNCSGHFPIRIVLFAHHSFFKMLEYKKMVAFGQRIKRIYYLKPLNFEETREYIYFRLIHSGATGTPVFDDHAIALIQTVSKGSPRLINNICDNCLLVAGNKQCNLIDPYLVNQAMEMGNLMGFKKVQATGDFAVNPRAIPANEPIKNPLRGDSGHEKRYTTESPEDNHPLKSIEKKPRGQYYNSSAESPNELKYEPPLEEERKRNNQGSFGSRYGKMIVIILLTVLIMVLAFYAFAQDESYETSGLQNHNNQIIVTGSKHFYTVEKSDELKNKGAFLGETNNPSLFSIKNEAELSVKKKYQPIILMEKLM
jgi:general secretion pathway protein A